MMQRRCDVLVVGLGPAGGAAAAAAARAGLRVIAIDRRKEIGVPVQCAEFIPLPLGRHAQDEGVLQQRITGMTTYLPSGAMVETEFPGLMIDRAAFDQGLAGAAARAGAELLPGSMLRALRAADSLAQVETREGGGAVRYRALVAADGPHSRVAQCLGLPRLKTVHTRQYAVALLRKHAATDIWLSDAFPGGYAWLFPKGREANLGVGADRRHTADLKTPLDRLHRQLRAQGRVGADILSRTGGAIPVGGLRDSLVVGNVLFVGDAAGLTHPITGAGISAAVISGEQAGAACAAWLGGDARALHEFEEDVRDQFEGTIRRGLRVREELERVWRTPAARADATHRRGWIAFKEYFGT